MNNHAQSDVVEKPYPPAIEELGLSMLLDALFASPTLLAARTCLDAPLAAWRVSPLANDPCRTEAMLSRESASGCPAKNPGKPHARGGRVLKLRESLRGSPSLASHEGNA